MRPTKPEFDPVHHALADIPEFARDEAMASHWDTSSNLILNNGGQLSTLSQESNPFAPVHQLARFPYPLSSPEMKERPWAKRDWVRAELREFGLKGADWQTLAPDNYWLWRSFFRQTAMKLEGIENNHHDSFAEFNFLTCGGAKSFGWEIQYKENGSRLSSFSCGKTSCPGCNDKDKERTARRFFNKLLAAATAQGIKRFWAFVFTFPEAIEAQFPKGSKERKALLCELKKFERKLFGLKTEDGLFAYANIHAVGDTNLMRDRFHVHSGVLPIAIRRVNKKPQVIKCDIQGKIDVDAARELLADHLEQVFPEIDRSLVQFNARYFRLESKRSVAQLAHRLKYDLRGFGKDVENAPIFFDVNHGLVVLDGGKDDYGIYTVRQVALRWKWIRSQRDLRTWGLLNQWNKYAELLGVEYKEDSEPEIQSETPVSIVRAVGRRWIHERSRIKWVNEKKAYRLSGEEITKIEWGRKGSEGKWQPKPKEVPSE